MNRNKETDELGIHCGICSSELLPQEVKATEDSREPRCVLCAEQAILRFSPFSLTQRIYNAKILLLKKKGKDKAAYIYAGAIGYLGYRRVGELNFMGKLKLLWILKNWKENKDEETNNN